MTMGIAIICLHHAHLSPDSSVLVDGIGDITDGEMKQNFPDDSHDRGRKRHTHAYTLYMTASRQSMMMFFASLTRQGEPLAIQDTNMLPVVRTMS